MIAYSYNQQTGEYLGEVECQLDQLETVKQKKNIYLIPAGATSIKPIPKAENEILIFNGEWSVIENTRDKIYYHKQTLERITDVLTVSDDYTDLQPPELFPLWDGAKWTQDIEKLRDYRLNQLNYRTAELIAVGFTYDGVKFGASDKDQINWNSLLLLKSFLTYPDSSTVKDYDGNYYTITSETEVENIVLAGFAMVNSYRASHKILKDKIKNATTVKQINDIIDERT